MWDHNEDEAALDEHDADVVNGTDTDDDFSETAVLDTDEPIEDSDVDDAYEPQGAVDDFVGDASVVFDVEDLIAEFEAEGMQSAASASRLRRRLEAIAERKRRQDDLVDFADYDLD